MSVFIQTDDDTVEIDQHSEKGKIIISYKEGLMKLYLEDARSLAFVIIGMTDCQKSHSSS